MPREHPAGQGGWIDLTRPIDSLLPVYAEDGYRDPPVRAHRWCAVGTRGYEVWRLELGSQSGTHIDAPAHFVAGGARLETLDPGHLIGRYYHVHTRNLAAVPIRPDGTDAPILFLDASEEPAIAADALEALLALPCLVWVMAGEAQVTGGDRFHLHRRLAEAGRFLIEDLDPGAVSFVPTCGEMVALPLRLHGTSGAPVRLLVRAVNPTSTTR